MINALCPLSVLKITHTSLDCGGLLAMFARLQGLEELDLPEISNDTRSQYPICHLSTEAIVHAAQQARRDDAATVTVDANDVFTVHDYSPPAIPPAADPAAAVAAVVAASPPLPDYPQGGLIALGQHLTGLRRLSLSGRMVSRLCSTLPSEWL